MPTNEATLNKLSAKLQALVKNSKRGGKYVKGGMYGVEQVARIVEELDTYVRAATTLTYNDIDTINSSIESIISVSNSVSGIPFSGDLLLKGGDNNKYYTYIGDDPLNRVILPLASDLIGSGYSSWEVTLQNSSVNGSDINILAQSGNAIDGVSSINFNYGYLYNISWNGNDTFTSTLGSGGGGGGGGDTLTDHIQDVESDTYYYYGLNRNGNWEVVRNEKADVNTETKATQSNNPSYSDLSTAWTNRITLVYV